MEKKPGEKTKHYIVRGEIEVIEVTTLIHEVKEAKQENY